MAVGMNLAPIPLVPFLGLPSQDVDLVSTPSQTFAHEAGDIPKSRRCVRTVGDPEEFHGRAEATLYSLSIGSRRVVFLLTIAF